MTIQYNGEIEIDGRTYSIDLESVTKDGDNKDKDLTINGIKAIMK